MKVGDKVIVDPTLPRLYDSIWAIPMELVKDRIMTIRRVGDSGDGTHYCYVEEESYIFLFSIFISAEGTLFLSIYERRQHEERR